MLYKDKVTVQNIYFGSKCSDRENRTAEEGQPQEDVDVPTSDCLQHISPFQDQGISPGLFGTSRDFSKDGLVRSLIGNRQVFKRSTSSDESTKTTVQSVSFLLIEAHLPLGSSFNMRRATPMACSGGCRFR